MAHLCAGGCVAVDRSTDVPVRLAESTPLSTSSCGCSLLTRGDVTRGTAEVAATYRLDDDGDGRSVHVAGSISPQLWSSHVPR